MIISAKIIKRPRIARNCGGFLCGKPILGWQLRLYGLAHRGDPGCAIYMHPGCASYDPKTHQAIKDAMA